MIRVVYEGLEFKNITQLVVDKEGILIVYDDNKHFIRPTNADIDVSILEDLEK